MFTPPPSPRPAARSYAQTTPATSKDQRTTIPAAQQSYRLRPSTPSPLASPLPSPRHLSASFNADGALWSDDQRAAMSMPSSSKTSPKTSPVPPLPFPTSSPTPDPQTQLKRRIGRRIKWAAILLPLTLLLVTALSHRSRALPWPTPISFSSLFRSQPHLTYTYIKPSCRIQVPPSPSDDNHHKRQETPSPTAPVAFPSAPASPSSPTPASASSQTSATLAATAQPIPTVPSSQPNNPPVPTPFPQPFDSEISTNFSSTSCYAFFQRMLNMVEFRSCRSFGLLMQSSDQFLKAQNNLTLMNTLLWGTCNTNTSDTQCRANMQMFATQLQTECSQDLKDGNARAVSTLTMINAYSLMRSSGCLIDPSSNTYCYLNAIHNTNPSDLYFYQLPVGTSLPRSSTPTCSVCVRSLMAGYTDALEKDARDLGGGNGTTSKVLTGLRKTYDAAAQRAVNECGSGYATLNVVSSGAVANVGVGASRLVLAVTVVLGLVISFGL